MKIIFLGTNGWYTSPTGNTPCILIDYYCLFKIRRLSPNTVAALDDMMVEL